MNGMSLFQWKSEYKLGHPLIDKQHQRLFELAGELHTAMLSGQGRQKLQATLDELVAYTKNHFATEEQLMQKFNYPDYAAHKREHDELTGKVVEFQKGFQSTNFASTLKVMEFLKDWLAHHIGETDRKVAAHVAKPVH